jgi:ABC-2 type transport system permease protein
VKLALQAEVLKVRTTKTVLGLAAAMVGLVLLAVILHALGLKLDRISTSSGQLTVLLEGGATIGALFAGLFGAMSLTGEIRHGTIRPTFLGIPQRGRVLAAKALTSVLAGAALGLVAAGIAAAVGSSAMVARGAVLHLGAGDYTRLLLGGAAGAALMAAIGLGVGALVRNQVATVVGMIVWLLFVENILGDSVPSVGRYMPGALARALAGERSGMLHSAPLALLLLVFYAEAIAVIGWRITLRRDVA